MLCRWLALSVLVAMTAPAHAQSWAQALFEQPNHDFGTVPRGPIVSHDYRLTNKTQSPVHIAGLRVSCGCVAATAGKNDLAPGDSTVIHATMDTRRFSGSKSVTIYVSFDRPQWAEVALNVSAFGRDDLALDNEFLGFGSLSRAASGSAKVTVTLRQPNWVVQGVKSSSKFVEPTVKEVRRTQGEAVYEISASLKPGLPVGNWAADVTLTTNSTIAPEIRVPALVDIQPMLTVNPGEVSLGSATVGTASETRVMVKGSQPFRIREIQGGDADLSASPNLSEARPVHIITVKFDPKQPGELNRKLTIVTDLPSEGTTEVTVKASVAPKP